jgi:methyl-accepting chemotaxis protein
MSADELTLITKTLAELDRESKETDRAVDDLKREADETTKQVEQLKDEAERIQRRLAAAS